ncbi:excinuclease ABC subunit UvrC [Candidatus Sororendozoicomonas aggregata]|uniref:excinuclease ABC subunit UvrC n=1 Tax=Candidatus Sororendozoicomonas aggregata TaxID=3073239 RepID=UPI002ED47B8C
MQKDQASPFDAKAFLEQTPQKAGVYDMRDSDGKTLYIGKAKNLKSRVGSYFRNAGLTSKTLALTRKIASIELIVTHTETEALLLEQDLIKRRRPPYNILLKDDKSYPYILITSDHPWPQIRHQRGRKTAKGQYFGPFPNGLAVRESLNLLQKVFKVRQCEDNYFHNRSRPCLQYQINRCKAPCVGLVSQEEYQQDIDDTVQFLNGKSQQLQNALTGRMEKAASQLDFESAATIRDQLISLQKVQEKQTVTKMHGSADVIGMAQRGGQVAFNVLFIRSGQITGNKAYFPHFKLDSHVSDELEQFLSQFYIRLAHARDFPAEVILPQPLPAIGALTEAMGQIAHKNIQIKQHVRGDRANWLTLSNTNANQQLSQHLTDKTTHKDRIEQLASLLNLPAAVQRIHCFDISHTQGESTVASSVSFGPEGPISQEYRLFNIQGVTAGDDYAAMYQALNRRYKNVLEGKEDKPGLIIIDGGKGQLTMAGRCLTEMVLADIPLLGIAKGATRKHGMETLLYKGQTIQPEGFEAAFLLIQHIRDEAHRFAITGHRQRRQKTRNRSLLEDIPGVGAKRRSALLNHFGGRQGVVNASVAELSKVTGISPHLAQVIYNAIHAQ